MSTTAQSVTQRPARSDAELQQMGGRWGELRQAAAAVEEAIRGIKGSDSSRTSSSRFRTLVHGVRAGWVAGVLAALVQGTASCGAMDVFGVWRVETSQPPLMLGSSLLLFTSLAVSSFSEAAALCPGLMVAPQQAP